MRARLLFPLAVLIACPLVTTGAHAQDTSGLLEVLDENVVSGASRSAESASDAPALSTTITADQLRRFGIRRLDEALNFLSLGMFAQDRLSTPEVGARGVALTRDNNNHTLVVLDGMIMNEQAGGAVYLHDVPLDVIDHIEVILGPGSVLYGAQAMFGVINVVTKRGDSDHQYARGRASFGFSPPFDSRGAVHVPTVSTLGTDNQFSGSGAFSFPVFGKPAEVTALIDYSDFKGPAFDFALEPLSTRSNGSPIFDVGPHGTPGFWGGTVQNQWFHRTMGGFLRIDYGDFSFMTRVTMTQLAMPQMDSFENRVGGAFDDPNNLNTYGTVLANLRYQRRLSDKLSAFGRAYFGYSDTQYSRFVLSHDLPVQGTPLGIIDPEECPIGPPGPCRKTSTFLSRWVGLELQGTYDWSGSGAYTTMLGVDTRFTTAAYEFVTFDDFTAKSYGSDPGLTRWHGGGFLQGDEAAVGAYVQQILHPFKRLEFNLGVRGDYDPRVAQKDQGSAISPRAAVMAKATDHLTLKAIYSTAFRAPSFLELNEVQGRLLPDSNGLRPETVSSFETIASLRLGAQTLSLGGFYSEWRNLIELQIVKAQAPVESDYANVSNLRNYGTNLYYETSVIDHRVGLGLNFTAAIADRQLRPEQQARNPGIGDTVPVTVAPKVFGNARVSYDFRDPASTVAALAARVFGPQIADQAYIGGDPSNLSPRPTAPPQLELRGMVTGEITLVPGLSYSLGLDYAFGHQQPYVVGPNQGLPRYLVSSPTAPQLAPVNPMTAFIGFEFTMDAKTADPSKPAKPEPEAMRPVSSSASNAHAASPTPDTLVLVDRPPRGESP